MMQLEQPIRHHTSAPVLLQRFSADVPSATKATERGMMLALDLLGRAGFLIDQSRRVVCSSAAATAALGDGLTLSGGQLRAATRATDRVLQSLIDHCLWERCANPAPVALAQARSRPLLVEAVPLREQIGTAVALVTVDRERRTAARVKALAAAYALTAAERTLVELLIDGGGLVRAAGALGVSVSTVRTHLKAIFAKTETHSQAALAALFAR